MAELTKPRGRETQGGSFWRISATAREPPGSEGRQFAMGAIRADGKANVPCMQESAHCSGGSELTDAIIAVASKPHTDTSTEDWE